MVGLRYKNLKNGKIYTVVAVAKHTEIEELLIVYRDNENNTYAKPYQLFIEKFNNVRSSHVG